MLGPKKMLVKKKFQVYKMLGPAKFWVQENIGKKVVGQNKFLVET